MPLGGVLLRFQIRELSGAVEPGRGGDGRQGNQRCATKRNFPRKQAPYARGLGQRTREFRSQHSKGTFTHAAHVAGDQCHTQQIRTGQQQRFEEQRSVRDTDLPIDHPH